MLRSGQRVSDILDPSTINLAPVPDMYTAFMRTLIKPAPQQQQQRIASSARLATADASLALGVNKVPKGRQGKRGGDKGLVSTPAVMDEGLLAVFAKKLKA